MRWVLDLVIRWRDLPSASRPSFLSEEGGVEVPSCRWLWQIWHIYDLGYLSPPLPPRPHKRQPTLCWGRHYLKVTSDWFSLTEEKRTWHKKRKSSCLWSIVFWSIGGPRVQLLRAPWPSSPGDRPDTKQQLTVWSHAQLYVYHSERLLKNILPMSGVRQTPQRSRVLKSRNLALFFLSLLFPWVKFVKFISHSPSFIVLCFTVFHNFLFSWNSLSHL